MSQASSFGFNASAVAFGGLIKSPRQGFRPIRGRVPSVALSPTGGRVESFSRRYNREGIRYDDALTVVEGARESDTAFTTTVRMELSNLNIFDQVCADRIEALITSHRDLADPIGDSKFTIDAKLVGLAVDGESTTAPLNLSLFEEIPTYARFLEFFSNDDNMNRLARFFDWNLEASGSDSPKTMIEAAKIGSAVPMVDPVRCSLVTSDMAGEKFSKTGYTLELKNGRGRIHLAEVLIKPGRRRLNMLRFELRKPPRGLAKALNARSDGDTYDGAVCSGEGNGSSTYPP